MTTKSTKSKHEVHLVRQIHDVFLPLHFEFESPLSLEECVSRLNKNLNRGSLFLNNQYSFRSKTVDAANSKYFVFAQVGTRLWVEASGTLQMRATNLTCLSGVAKTSRAWHILNWLCAVCLVSFIAVPVPVSWEPHVSEVALMFWLIGYVITYIFSSFKRGKLIDQIENLLLSD
jgi:hypothetical protein